ncbi:hypothetical protein AgCh_019894 [Apium graveolens]
MTTICVQSDELDPVQQFLLSVERVESLENWVPRLSREEYAKHRKEKMLAEHRDRIRDGGFVGDDDVQYLSKRSKLKPVGNVDQLITNIRETFKLNFRKMVDAQEEAVQKLYERGLADAPCEDFCGSYGALKISP